MKEELTKIGLELRDWCKKYNKAYVSVAYIEDSIMINVDVNDKDYRKLQIFIEDDEDN